MLTILKTIGNSSEKFGGMWKIIKVVPFTIYLQQKLM